VNCPYFEKALKKNSFLWLSTVILLIALTGCSMQTATETEVADAEITETVAPTINPDRDTAQLPSSDEPGIELVPDNQFVRVIDYIPSIYVDLKYSTTDNFTGSVIYEFTDAYLRYGTVKKLATIQDKLTEQGYSLKIWDAFRPVAAQFKLWQIYPDPVYVANPNTGYSSHSKGNTLDVTLVNLDGTAVEMPSEFDEFSALADRDYSDVSIAAKTNASLLEGMMTNNGFNAYSGEWWHFSDTIAYPVEEDFVP